MEAYRTLEQNLKSLGLERGTNDDGQAQHFSWRKSVGGGVTVVVDLLCDAANSGNGGQVVELSRERRLSALNIPGAHLVTRDYIEVEITTDLLDGRGVSTEIVRVANIVPFLVLKALAYDDRFEEKDAYDLIYCLMNYGRGPEEVAALVADRLADRIDEELLVQALDILRARFASDEHTPGSRKDGPVSYARFLVDSGRSDLNARRRQDAADAVDRFFRTLDNEHQAMSIRSQ